MFKYINRYRSFTIADNGKLGNLYYGIVTLMLLAIVFVAIGIIIKITL